MNPSPKRQPARRRDAQVRVVAKGDTNENKLCCCECEPNVLVWIDTASMAIAVENSIVETRHYEVKRHLDTHANADAKPAIETRSTTNASLQVPGGAASSADSLGAARAADDTSSDSGTLVDDDVKKDVEVRKDQAKVYKTDTYTVHWKITTRGCCDRCSDLHVSLRTDGAVAYEASWVPHEGRASLTTHEMLHPPNYASTTPPFFTATVQATTCNGVTVRQTVQVPRP